jgi:hypothetical protein
MFKKIVAVSLITTALVVPSQAAFAYDSENNHLSTTDSTQAVISTEVLADLVPVQSEGKITPAAIYYKVNSDGVRIRSTPSLSGTIKGLLYINDIVKTNNRFEIQDGYVWIYVESSPRGVSGWVAFQYLS